MNGWVIPAPAPWAKTKHARAFGGRSRSAETDPAFTISMSSFCTLAIFIRSNRYSLHHPQGHGRQRCKLAGHSLGKSTTMRSIGNTESFGFGSRAVNVRATPG